MPTGLCFAEIRLLRAVWFPVALDADVAVPLSETQAMSRFQFLDCPISGEWRGHAHKREIIVNSLAVNVATDIRMKQQRAKLRTEYELAIDLRVKERLLTDAVARQE